jgi:phosphoglycerate dehydrogenase-like enzyme
MPEPPTVVLAMAPALTTELFTPALRARLAALAALPDPEPLQRFDDERALRLLADADVLLSGWGCPRIDADVLARAPRLRAIVHAAGTVKGHVDEAAWARGVRVSSAAAANAVPVAEYTLAAILLAGKRVFRLQRRYRELRGFRLWPREVPAPLGNLGRTVGIVGASRIGRLVLERLRPFDFTRLVADPFLDPSEARALGAERVELDALLARADVVSLHAPLLPETRGMIDRRRLALLRDGAILINTARGGLVDTTALTDELASGRLDAVLDVTEPEVLPADSPLFELPNVFLTPHVAGAMGAETQRLAALAIDEIERLSRGEPLAHEVRREDLARVA